MHLSQERSVRRISRLKRGDWSFGCSGMHSGVGTEDCPKERHHHHDNFCKQPTIGELFDAELDPTEFKVRSRA